MLSIYYIH